MYIGSSLTQSLHEQRQISDIKQYQVGRHIKNVQNFGHYRIYSSMHLFVSLYVCWLKPTNNDVAIGKYLFGGTPFLKDEIFQFL